MDDLHFKLPSLWSERHLEAQVSFAPKRGSFQHRRHLIETISRARAANPITV